MRAVAATGVHHQPAHQVDHRDHFAGNVFGSSVRVHVFEFICGGGLGLQPSLSASLAREGDLMLAAVLDDLLELPHVEVSFARDARLALPQLRFAGQQKRAARACWRSPGAPPAEAFAREISSSDAVWPIAPETGGELERAARAVLDAHRMLLGSQPRAIAVAGSKSATAQRLQEKGIAVVPCFLPGEVWPAIDGPWVVKPDDGAGGLRSSVFETRELAARAVAGATGKGEAKLVAQPWIEGDAMSLCALASPHAVVALSVNRQHLRIEPSELQLQAIEVNCEPVDAQLARLTQQVAEAIPGLRGYFGIDFVRGPSGPVVIEVNPRLTTSYAGLRAALGWNVAQWVLADAAGEPLPPSPATPRRTVTLKLNGEAIG